MLQRQWYSHLNAYRGWYLLQLNFYKLLLILAIIITIIDLSGVTHVHMVSSDEEDEEQPSHTDRKPANHKLMQKMYILRFRLLHFVNCLHNYIMTRVSLPILMTIISIFMNIDCFLQDV